MTVPPPRHRKPRHPVPSSWVMKYGPTIAAARGSRVLDIPSGFGRNAFHLASLGCQVTCADRDERALAFIRGDPKAGAIPCVKLDLLSGEWPFAANCFDAAIVIDFYFEDIFRRAAHSLIKGGLLLYSSFGGRGGNYLDLPPSGTVPTLASGLFQIEELRERPVGPQGQAHVAFCFVGRKL